MLEVGGKTNVLYCKLKLSSVSTCCKSLPEQLNFVHFLQKKFKMYFSLLSVLYSRRATPATTQENIILTGSLLYN